MYPAATLATVYEVCLTYIVIQIITINEIFCDGAITYNTTVSPSHGQIDDKNQKISNITGLTINTLYVITIDALREDSRVHQTRIIQSTLQPISKYVYVLYCM